MERKRQKIRDAPQYTTLRGLLCSFVCGLFSYLLRSRQRNWLLHRLFRGGLEGLGKDLGTDLRHDDGSLFVGY